MSTALPRTEPHTIGAPAAPAAALDTNPADLRLLFRWIAAMLIVATALAACVWTRMAVRSTALELDAARGSLARAEIQQERLRVERSLLRAPDRLETSASALGLVPPAAIVTVSQEEQQP
jgi:hypothetical protein